MKRYQRFSGIVLAAMMFLSEQVAAQVVRIAEMNTRQIRALNLQKTVVVIPGGILEEHGPYLHRMPVPEVGRPCNMHSRGFQQFESRTAR